LGKFEKALSRYAELIPEYPVFLQAVQQPAPIHLRVNTLKTTVESVAEALASQGLGTVSEAWCPLLLRVDAECGHALGATLLHSLGHIYIQSASSAVAALALGPRAGERILDLCAAPGSKSTLIAQLTGDEGCLVANEPNSRRLKSLTTNLERMGVTSAVVTAYSGQNFPRKPRFDRVLVDAPCSGEGTWRGPEARPKAVDPGFREYLTRQQRALLLRAYETLEPGGALVYSTCTYAPEENEAVVGPFLEETGALVEALGLDIAGEPGLTAWEGRRFPAELARARRLYPHRFDSEGFFVVRLVKP